MTTEGIPDVHVVVAHRARATLRVGDVVVKVDPDRAGIDAEVAAMALAPVPTPEVLWRHHPVLAIGLVPGTALGTYGHPSPVGPGGWTAAGAAVRALHDATPLPPWGGRSLDDLAVRLDEACAWFVRDGVVPVDVLEHNRRLAQRVLRPWTPVFAHGDLQPDHVFVLDDRVTGIIDWSGAGPGDPLHDLAVLTLGHPEHVDDVVAGYGDDVDLDVLRGWWSYRSLTAIPWLAEHGFGPVETYPETAVLLAATH
ncbi:phosphotransferase family protein [Cellulomonas sp. 179-A 9B4 NHS]|uniref:phosphotransferase family protein n=1 Tax=Cellulomonas sp. 179-A 9B4 NHS TaxID=3142379 RepID=UPI00399F00EF